MSQNKTTATQESVRSYLDKVEDEQKRKDSFELLKMNEEILGKPAVMWGNSLIGFGSYHYQYESGREGDFFVSGFSPRKTALTIYIMSGFSRYNSLMSQLGKYKTGKSCLYVKKLDDIDRSVLKKLIKASVKDLKEKYPD